MTEIEKARELFVSCRLKEAKPLLEELAGAGDSDALYMLAMMTYDVDIAIELLAKSAAKGNAGAKLMRLALMADASEETIAEAEKSIIPEIEKGAEEDPVLADALGTFYLVYGKKREGWTEKGMALLSIAEQKEYWKASIHLGSAFNELRENPLGDADQFNPGEAIIHFSFAAVKGAPEAEYFMGFLVYRGLGTKQDQKAAIQLWKKAAASGYMTAALTLGFVLSFSKNEKEKKDGFKYTKMQPNWEIRRQKEIWQTATTTAQARGRTDVWPASTTKKPQRRGWSRLPCSLASCTTKTARTTKPLKYSGNPRKTAIRHQWDGWPLVMKMGMEQKETGKWRNSG